jgi:hypothetical protein
MLKHKLKSSKYVELEVNAETSKCMFISYQQNIKQNHIIRTADKFVAMRQRSSAWK